MEAYVRQQKIIRDMCRKEYYPEDGFNELSEIVSDNLINALFKFSATKEAIGKQIIEMKTQMNDRNRQEASTSVQPSTSQQQQNQFGNNYRGYQQGYRGNRGFPQQRKPHPNQSNRGNQPFREQYP